MRTKDISERPLPEVILGMKEVSNLIQSYTYPLFRYDENGRPTLFDIRGQGGMAQGINGEEFDIAALKIDSEIVREHALRAIPPSMLTTAVEVQNPHSRAFCGFPVSKNKPADSLDRRTKMVTTRCYPYFGPADFDGDYQAFGKSAEIHVGLHYEPGPDDSGRLLTTLPSPRGSSGGGAWFVPDFSRPDQVFLEGIVIECHENRHVFSTRIEHVLDFIRDRVRAPM